MLDRLKSHPSLDLSVNDPSRRDTSGSYGTGQLTRIGAREVDPTATPSRRRPPADL